MTQDTVAAALPWVSCRSADFYVIKHDFNKFISLQI